MASDLSNIFKDELSNTLEQLLSKNSQIDAVTKLVSENFDSTQLVECSARFDLKGVSSEVNFYIPTLSATKFEYLMLGGMGDLKEHIDDEITDAVNEIISNICGSFCTSVNAQGLPDIGAIKSEIKSSSIVEGSSLSSKKNAYEFIISLGNEKLPIIISFDELILPFFSSITGVIASDETEVKDKIIPSVSIPTNVNTTSSSSVHTSKNLELLYNVKLKLSVRLGTKVVLLKDILRWDVGEIIELEQMVNEPLEILVNGVRIGEGEAVIVEGKFGLKIKKIGNEDLRLNQLVGL
ncbi:MAG: FliM/FliN family flagellar motor switch protein [Arcobacter sp.]|uniref:Flagellar motor switch protein FliN n=1 Tax=Arcobacter defluvii TaxID=873191 RepID=A0AAE7BFD5_9BACT|nr:MULTISPECIES: FliM/FliN family flagellar motor switch protein [Arcobacter]MDY3200129.1 FliM/FliN family flagellar motor switch protein [Arcobacter sp.]QKF78480.1 flagellar motor switch C-ring protein FliY [Arcobacter defluvii]RXI31324.1 flagellar motor switch protein FliY [Arcobacter defluvii]BAK74260.1 flagellar motor switch protein FliY [Arcobacter sp. L]